MLLEKEKISGLIYIVDDIAVNSKMLAAILKNDYETGVACSGKEFFELLATGSRHPDLILLDVDMPEMNGYEVCKQLKQDIDTADIPVIFVTSNSEKKDEEIGFNVGAVDYVTKPISPPILLARVKTHLTLKHQRDLLQEMAMRDQLTSVFNRYYLLESANHRLSHSTRHGIPLSVLMIDIDHFKRINDTYGHFTGDEVLKEVAGVLKKFARKEDVVARFGGEEFVIILDSCDIAAATDKAEKLRALVSDRRPAGIKVTTSIGVSQYDEYDKTFSDILNKADIAVYEAKRQGRDRVSVYAG